MTQHIDREVVRYNSDVVTLVCGIGGVDKLGSLVRTVAQNFFMVGPHAGAHRVAPRAGTCLAGPLLVLYLIGRIDLAIYASFGAFAGIYGRNDSYAQRIYMQATAGFSIVAAMVIGTLVSYLETPEILRIVAVALIAGIMTVLAYCLAWKPTGSLFMVFGSGACATIPATGTSFLHVTVVAGGAVLFSLCVTGVLALLKVPPRYLFMPPTIAPVQKRFVVNATLTFSASLIAGWLGLLLFETHWYWAMVAAIAVLVGQNIHVRLTRGLQRFLGTVVGVVLAAGIMWIDLPIVVVLAIAIFCQGFIEMIVLRNYAAAMIFITVIALLMVNIASPVAQETLMFNRIMETLVGVIVGMIVTVLAQMKDVERWSMGQ